MGETSKSDNYFKLRIILIKEKHYNSKETIILLTR